MTLRKLLLLTVCCLLPFVPVAEAADEAVRLGVMRFLSRTDGVSEQQAEAIGDVFTRMLTNSRTISVIERDQLDVIAAEHKLSMAGTLDPSTAAKGGRLLGCQYMLMGSVTSLARRDTSVNVLVVGTSKQEASATIDARVVDVETGEVILSLSETGTSSQTGTSVNLYGVSALGVQLGGMEGRAIAAAVSNLGFKVRENLTGEYAKVVSASGKDITLNVGATSGVGKGGIYRIYAEGEEILDVDGSALGRRVNTLAVVRITEAQNDFSIANVVKNGGNVALIKRGDKVSPIFPADGADLIKRKAFAKDRPRQSRSIMASLTPESAPALAKRPALPAPSQPRPQPQMTQPQTQPKVTPAPSAAPKAKPAQPKPQAQPKAAPAPKAEPKPTLSEPVRQGHGGILANIKTKGFGAHIRTGPGKSYNIVNLLKNGTPIEVMEYSEQSDGTWAQVYGPDSRLGWVFAQYIEEPKTAQMKPTLPKPAQTQSQVQPKVSPTPSTQTKPELPTSAQTQADDDESSVDPKAALAVKAPDEALLRKAENGDAEAQYQMGVVYADGKGVMQNYPRAREWYLKAANQGLAKAQNRLGVLYSRGRGVPQDYVQAREWYLKAAEQGYAWAQNNLGSIYYNGKGVAKNYKQAFEWFQKAAVQGNSDSQNMLGLMYRNGRGVKRSNSEALKWYRKAAEQGQVSAQHNVAFMYEYGYGVAKNNAKAIEWYTKAAEQGHEDAKKALKRLGH